MQLAHEIKNSCRVAPRPSDVNEACKFWHAFINSLTHDDIASWFRFIVQDLSAMDDDDTDHALEYEHLMEELGHVRDTAKRIFDAASAKDPSGREEIYTVAEQLNKRVETVVNVVHELVVLRGSGVECLVEAARSGTLNHRL